MAVTVVNVGEEADPEAESISNWRVFEVLPDALRFCTVMALVPEVDTDVAGTWAVN